MKDIFTDLLDEILRTPTNTKPLAEERLTEVALAGTKKEEITIYIDDNDIVIKVNGKKVKGEKRIGLTEYHDIEKSIVKLEDGLLTIVTPLKKLEQKKERTLQIQ